MTTKTTAGDTNIETAEMVSFNAPTTDRFVIRMVVLFIGLAVLVGISFIGALVLFDKAVPDSLVALPSAALGALGALLARTSSG